ncbi:hypothetical protein H310_00241 [Aphanomyces invadans]|uniref:Uncharacterized protein n=1 Tax=Aphanomyces invadans TaxID=157072 RepID=A0A024UTB2_9STRA|nr:hypothetical protein H310_00241 [Aphanomyces invadans]ETW09756.1 hypothetical protein H310_00241 [Aphanomyces invadans]|eukprot:XP_008861167.1 hypothetical protein H310_00241 [Aphanomyces invadans]
MLSDELSKWLKEFGPAAAVHDALHRYYDYKLAIFAHLMRRGFKKILEGMVLDKFHSAFRSVPEAKLNVSSGLGGLNH